MTTSKDQKTLAVTVRVGELLFQFTTFEQWLAKASSWFRNSGVSGEDCLCLDAMNRVCRVGKQFIRAKEEQTFPVRVYRAII